MELDRAVAALRGEDDADTVTFFIQLNQYRADRPGEPTPAPGVWLSSRWSAAYPDLPTLDDLLTAGRVIFLLDALYVMPAESDREFREHLGWRKDWLVRLAKDKPGNRIVFSCRMLDYSAPLSTPALRVPQVRIEALSDEQVHEFLRLYSPLRGEAIWAANAGTPQLEALRAPFFLALLVDQVVTTGELAGDRAGHFTGFVRQAQKREVERDNPLFALEELLASRDLRRIAQWQWRDAYELPERGSLVPRLSALASGMQSTETDGEQSQVRVDYEPALDLVDHPNDVDIVKAGLAISVLDEDPAADEVLYRHQLLQEHFAARVLAREPKPGPVEEFHDRGSWDAEVYERWKRRLAMAEAELDQHLRELYPGGRKVEPLYWRDERFNNPAQPVVGVCWYEARAHCSWLALQRAWRCGCRRRWSGKPQRGDRRGDGTRVATRSMR